MRTTMAKTTLLKQHWCNVLVLVSIAVKITAGEDPRPEIFIPAKNFNPHPYELAAQTGERNGPVLFPPNPEDNLVESRSNFVTLTNFPNRDSHPVDSHPYAKVARKHKYRVIGRFDDEDPRVNEHARKALAKHAAQVLSYPPEKLAKYKTVSEQQGKDYAFSYKVVDRLRGDDFSHSQTRNSKATSGEYRVKLPDGRVQIVSYTADKNGYKADVKYTEDEGVTDQRGGGPRQGDIVQFQRTPVKTYPGSEIQSFDYPDDAQPPNSNIVVFQAVSPTKIYRNFNGHRAEEVAITPSPAYLNALLNRQLLQKPPSPKVEIFTTNARDYSIGSYIPSTVTPYFQNINLERRIVSPEITNNGDYGLSVPGTTPSSFVLTDHQGLVFDNIKLASTTSSALTDPNGLASTTPSPLVLSGLYPTDASRYH